MPVRLARRALPLPGGPLLACGVVAAALLGGPEARASDACQLSPLISTCINADTFWPHAGPQRFVGVGGVETDGAGRFGFGLVTDYQSRPIVFHVAAPGGSGSDQYAVNDQVNGNFLWSYGITRRLELDFALPVTFGQTGSGASPITGSNVALHDTAVRDLRFGLAYQLVSPPPAAGDSGWGLTARFETSAPTGDRDQYAGDRTAVFVPSLAVDYRSGRVFAGAEIGARIRPDAQLEGANVGPQGIIGMGVGYDLARKRDRLGVMLEARTLPTFSTQYTPVQTAQGTLETSSSAVLAPSEWMIALRSSPVDGGDFSITAGGGGAIPTGDASITTPRFRFVLGLRYAPTHAEPARPPPAASAVPGISGAAPSVIVLDLASKQDRCKDEPDTVDGFKDDDGCPDEDTDKDGIDDRYDRCPLVSEDFAGTNDGCPEVTPRSAPPKTP